MCKHSATASLTRPTVSEKGWAKSWRANGWRKKDKTPALNADLWQQLLDQLERHKVRFHWVKGHAGHPENERCDRLAFAAANGDNLLPDEPYAFSLQHAQELCDRGFSASVAPIDGRDLSWYGPRLPGAVERLALLSSHILSTSGI